MLDWKDEDLKEVLIFTLKLCIFSALLYLISWKVNLFSFQQFTAKTVHEFMIVVGSPVKREGIRLIADGSDFIITKDCTAWKGMIFLFALLASTGKSLKEVGRGLIVGLPVIYSINLLRIIILIASTMKFSPAVYGLLHDTLWHSTMILAVLILWIMWRRRTNFLTGEMN